MDNDKLLIGGVIVIVLVIAIPILAPYIINDRKYDPVADSHKLERLNKAVTAYGQKNGQYPPSLYYLVPDYIGEVPVTSTRLQFDYNPSNGVISNPSAPVLPGERSKKASGYQGRGVSATTEAMTGLSASEDLNF